MLMHEHRCVVGHPALEEFHRARHYAKMVTPPHALSLDPEALCDVWHTDPHHLAKLQPSVAMSEHASPLRQIVPLAVLSPIEIGFSKKKNDGA
jgi:hypothetical protein